MRSRQSEVSLLVMALFILGALALSACGSSGDGDGDDNNKNGEITCPDVETISSFIDNAIIGTWELTSSSVVTVIQNTVFVTFQDDWNTEEDWTLNLSVPEPDQKYIATMNVTDTVSGCSDTGQFYLAGYHFECDHGVSVYMNFPTTNCPMSDYMTGRYDYLINGSSMKFDYLNETFEFIKSE